MPEAPPTYPYPAGPYQSLPHQVPDVYLARLCTVILTAEFILACVGLILVSAGQTEEHWVLGVCEYRTCQIRAWAPNKAELYVELILLQSSLTGAVVDFQNTSLIQAEEVCLMQEGPCWYIPPPMGQTDVSKSLRLFKPYSSVETLALVQIGEILIVMDLMVLLMTNVVLFGGLMSFGDASQQRGELVASPTSIV